jgi:hypothetical protein
MAEKRYTTLVVRLVLDHKGGLERGELVDGEAHVVGRFVGRHGLWRKLDEYLRGLRDSRPD